MRKLALLVLVALLAASLTAAILPTKVVRLTVINNSGYPVYMRLEGQIYGGFYYLTIPDGETIDFTIAADVYKRTTWACDGLESKGELVMMSQMRLNFTECFRRNLSWYEVNVWVPGAEWFDCDHGGMDEWCVAKLNFGEPTMEKVVYFKYVSAVYNPWFNCGWYVYSLKSYKSPLGCLFRYQY